MSQTTEQLFDFKLPSDPNSRQRFKSQIDDVIKCMTIIESQKTVISETLNEMKKEYELPVDVLRNLATAKVAENFAKNRQKSEAKFELVDEFDAIFGGE